LPPEAKGNNGVRQKVATRAARDFKRIGGCKIYHEIDKKTGVNVEWHQCEGYNGGRGVSKPFPIGDGGGGFGVDGYIEFGADVPEPVWTASAHWYTQRPGYFHLDAYQSGLSVPMRQLDAQGNPTGRTNGYAQVTPVRLIFDPGTGGKPTDCTSLEKMTRAYDRSTEHYSQDTDCWYTYYVSSIDPYDHKRYLPNKATLTVEWRIDSISLNNQVDNNINLPLRVTSSTKNIEVRERQAIVTCRRPKNECAIR
jgi:hypothetical protein